MKVFLLWVLSGRGLCDELITRREESYQLWCVVVCDLETSWMRRPWLTGGCRAKNKQTNNNKRKADSHSVHNSDPPRTRTYICLPLPQPVVTPPPPSGHSPSHWLRQFPTKTPSGINTPHVPSQSFFIHLPMKMEPIEGSETSDIRTKTPGNYPKENILHIEHGESLKSIKHWNDVTFEYNFKVCQKNFHGSQ